MQSTLPLQSWLEHLRLLLPLGVAVHVGAGTGKTLSRYEEWDIRSVILIDADEGCYDKLVVVASRHRNWSAHRALLGEREEEIDFHLVSNPNENSVLPPERLAGLWRNLKVKEQRRRTATTLDQIIEKSAPLSDDINWLLIDCLPALPILRGAPRSIDGCDVIVARVVLDSLQFQDTGASKVEVDTFLSEHGYRCVAWEEERNPNLGQALYVRDWKTSLLHQVRDVLHKQADLLADRDDARKELSYCKQRVEQMQAELTENALHLQALKEEIDKAEGQMELIKDLLLRGAGQ